MLRLRAVSSVVLLPAVVLAAGLGVAAGAVGAALPGTWPLWAALQLAVVVAGLAAAAVVGSRRLSLDDERLCFTSLTRRLSWRVADITAVTYQGHPSQSWHAHITLHHAGGVALRLNVYLWHQSELAALLRALSAARPGIRFSPAAQGYLAVAR